MGPVTTLQRASSPIGAIVPPSLEGRRDGASPGPSGSWTPAPPLPRPALPPFGALPEYGLGTVGANGRLSDRSMLRRLGRHPGTRLDLREDHGLVVVRADPHATWLAIHPPAAVTPAHTRAWGGDVRRATPRPHLRPDPRPRPMPARRRRRSWRPPGWFWPGWGCVPRTFWPHRARMAPRSPGERRCRRSPSTCRWSAARSATAPAGCTARTGSASWSTGPTGASTSPPRHRSSS